MMEYFSTTNHKLSDNSTTVTVTSSSYYQNAFGNVVIRSTSNESHCWQFKILKNKESYGIDIGIVEENHLDFEESFTSKGYGYGLCSNGNIYSSNCNKQNYKLKTCKQKYKPNDIVLMTLDLKNQTLSFVIDSNHKSNSKIIIPNIKRSEEINYRMAVYLSHKKDSIKLLNHIKTLCMEEKKENELEIMQNKLLKYEEMVSKLQNEFVLTKQANSKYKNDINVLETELKNIKDIKETNDKQNTEIINELTNKLKMSANENKLFKSNSNKLQKQLKKTKTESSLNLDRVCKANEDIVEKLQTENDRFIDILREQLRDKDIQLKEYKNKLNALSQQNDEYRQSNNRLQSRILTLQKENQSLRNNRDQTQKRNLNTRKQIESLQNQNNILKTELKQCKSRK